MSLTRRFKNRNLSIIVTIIMIMAMFPSIAFAASPTDLANHWAKVQVGDWMDKGLVNGYPDGTFKPDNNITRAEFMVIVNGAFGYKEKATVDYKDVTADAWYADAVAKAKAAGYFTGYADGTAKPDSPISRQETAVVIMKVKGLTQNESAAAKFTDAAGISQWSKGAIGATVTAGFMNGYPDGSFKANNPITRAEAVVALSKAMNKPAPTPEIPADDSKVYDQAGTYGPATGSITVTGDVTIKAKDVILQNTIIEGDLTIDKAVGDGNVTLKKVVVKGNTYINGGGTNSVYLIDTQTGKTYVIKDSGPVRIVASGTSDINQLIAQSSVKVEEADLTGKGFEGIIVDKKVDGKIEINLVNAKVDNFQVKTEGVTVNTDNNTTISTLVADAKVDVTGKGTVQQATINASGVTFETKPTTQTVASGVKEPTVNKSSSGGGGGGGGSSTVAVSGISVDKTEMTLYAGGATGKITATVKPTDASNKKVIWKSDNEKFATVDANGVVTPVAAGTATITATSDANSSKYDSCVVTVVKPTEANFVPIGNVGIAPDTAGDAAGKIYAEYKLVAGGENISLVEDNIKYIKVKVGEGDWQDLTANTDATLWFNVEATRGVRAYEVKTNDGDVYTATLNWDKEIKPATWESTGEEGTRPDTSDAYVEYKLMADSKQVPLKASDVKLVALKDKEKWGARELNTDPTLWFKKDNAIGNYEYLIVTNDVTIYRATLEWQGGDVYTALAEINDYLTSEKYVYANAPRALEGYLTTLGINVGAKSDYAALDKIATGGKNRKTAVFYDLNNNKPNEGYDLATLTTYFNDMVATRLVTEESMDLVNNAKNIGALNGISYVTMLLERFQTVSYRTHSDIPVADKVSILQDLVDRYEALGADGRVAVLTEIIGIRDSNTDKQFARSQHTTEALAAALTKIETEINNRLTITSVTIADNKAYASTAAGTVRVLGYGVGINLDAVNKGKKISDTTSIVIELYKGDTLLGQQSFNEAGYSKHGGASQTSGTIDAGGQYKATSWDNSWSAKINDIPDKAVATVQYDDGTATAEKALSFTEEQTNIFSAAQAVHALFEDVFAEESALALKEGVNQDDINAASALVKAVTLNTTQNKAVLEELITKAGTLLGGDQKTGQETNIQMMQAPIMNAEDPVAEESLQTEDEIEVAPEEANGNDEMTTEAVVENEANEEAIVEVDEAQAEEDEEVAVEAEKAEDISEGIQE